MTGMSLYDATKDLHHACEQHPFGARMSQGNVTGQEWADWLWSFKALHSVVDLDLPADFCRDDALRADLRALPTPRPSAAALQFAQQLVGQRIVGAAYVLHGAHCSGGRVMAPTLAKRGLPSAHTVYKDWKAVRGWLTEARSSEEDAELARRTFGCLLTVMDEIAFR